MTSRRGLVSIRRTMIGDLVYLEQSYANFMRCLYERAMSPNNPNSKRSDTSLIDGNELRLSALLDNADHGAHHCSFPAPRIDWSRVNATGYRRYILARSL